MDKTIRYTTAPEDYDGFGTKTLESCAALSRKEEDIRKVAIEDLNIHWQSNRYSSGLHCCLTQEQFDEWIAYGFARIV